MYFVKYGNQFLHDPRSNGQEYILHDLKISKEENSCGYCDFTIQPNHPMYGKLKERDANNPIVVYDDDVLLFSGFIYELGEEFYLSGDVKCKGDLEYLRESIVRPYATFQRGYGSLAPDSPDGYFEWLIEQHNAQSTANKQFKIGKNQVRSDSSNFERSSNEMPNTLDEILEKLVNNENVGGYIRVRLENGVRYIDYLSEFTNKNTQVLDFGVNLTDYVKTDNSEELATYVIPRGASMSETWYPYDDGYFVTSDSVMDPDKAYYIMPYQQCKRISQFEEGVTYYEKYNDIFQTSDLAPVEGITYYTRHLEDGEYRYERQDISSFTPGVTYYEQEDYHLETTDTVPSDSKNYYVLSMSFSEVNDLGRFLKNELYFEYDPNEDESDLPLTLDGLPTQTIIEEGYKISGDKVYCEEAVNRYGWIGHPYTNSDITTKEQLALVGFIVLKDLISPKRTIEIKAVDMHLVNPDIRPIQTGEYVRVRSTPHKMDSYFLCTSIDLDLNNPENSLYTLGTTYDTLTGQQNKRINELNKTINKQYETAVAISEEAKKTAVDAETKMEELKNNVRNVKSGEDAVVLRIDSSRGTVFKNNSISTVLTVTIYKGSLKITGIDDLIAIFGIGAHLEWSWQHIDDDSFGVISSSDSMISDNGFSLTISADDVNTKCTFMCELKV